MCQSVLKIKGGGNAQRKEQTKQSNMACKTRRHLSKGLHKEKILYLKPQIDLDQELRLISAFSTGEDLD